MDALHECCQAIVVISRWTAGLHLMVFDLEGLTDVFRII